jgi:nucleotide-binding universal stress UspA family protein
VRRSIETAEQPGGYWLKYACAFLDAVPDEQRARAAIRSLTARVDTTAVAPVGGVEGEALLPLDLSPRPGRRSRGLISEDQIETHLDAVESEQQQDGGWTVDWLAWSPAQTTDWRGNVTLRALIWRRDNGRLCYDGSDGSKAALVAAAELVAHPADAVVLTVWTPATVLLARGGSLGTAYVPNEGEIDEQESAAAQRIADEGAGGARRRGYNASARIAEATESVAKAIADVADEIDAGLIVCGQRGLGFMRSALLGSVSHAISARARRPVLIAPGQKR